MAARREAVIALALVLAVSGTAPLQAQSANPRVDSIFASFDKRDAPGCAVSVVEGGRTVFAKGYGMASLEHDVPITPTSAFYAASVSKQFTAFAVAMLAQQGKLSLDDDVRKWLPEVPNFGKTITVRHLIHHTSGLRDYFGLLGMTGWPGDGPVTEARFLDLVSRQKALNFDPGARHLYSNTGYVLLSILVKRVSGQSLREFSDQAIFGPLGMSNSHFRDDHTMLVKNRAFAYSPRAGGWQMNVPGFNVVGDGGLFTTVEDLAKWARNFDDHTVGGDELAARVLTRGRLTSGDSIPYAYGLAHNVFRGQPTIEHGGAYGGYRTNLLRFPAQHFAVAVLCNTSTANTPQLSQAVASVYLGDRLAPVTRPVASGASASTSVVRLTREQLSRYAGAYWDAKDRVNAADRGARFDAGPDGYACPLAAAVRNDVPRQLRQCVRHVRGRGRRIGRDGGDCTQRREVHVPAHARAEDRRTHAFGARRRLHQRRAGCDVAHRATRQHPDRSSWRGSGHHAAARVSRCVQLTRRCRSLPAGVGRTCDGTRHRRRARHGVRLSEDTRRLIEEQSLSHPERQRGMTDDCET